jgi:hypothetical protein
MQLPKDSAHYSSITRYGRYVARRLRRGGQDSLAKDILAVLSLVREKGREWDDSDDAVQDALADRDASDDDLDTVAQNARHNLASRSLRATREEPYTLVFHEGVGYYIAAPLDQEETRYEELAERITKHLPASDPLRKTAPPAIKKGLSAFKTAAAALQKAERERGSARTDLDHAIRNTLRQLEKVYGALVAEHGKAFAEGFFPKMSRVAKAKGPVEPTPEE